MRGLISLRYATDHSKNMALEKKSMYFVLFYHRRWKEDNAVIYSFYALI